MADFRSVPLARRYGSVRGHGSRYRFRLLQLHVMERKRRQGWQGIDDGSLRVRRGERSLRLAMAASDRERQQE